MCLAIPARVVERKGEDAAAVATVDLGGVRKEVSLALVPEARVDDYVIVHVGHAIGMVDPDEAAATLALFAELQGARGTASAASVESVESAASVESER